jgi:hypothetical protein
MAGVTDTQSLRFGQVSDVIDHTTVKNLADDIASRLDTQDLARTKALTRPEVYVQRNAALSVPVSTITVVPWDSEQIDTHAMVDLVGQPTRVTCGATAGTGIYLVGFYVSIDTTGWTRGDLLISINGIQYARRTWWGPVSGVGMWLDTQVYLSATTDFITGSILHEGGGSTSTFQATMRVQKVCDG